MAQGKRDEALKAYRQSLAIAERFATSAPSNDPNSRYVEAARARLQSLERRAEAERVEARPTPPPPRGGTRPICRLTRPAPAPPPASAAPDDHVDRFPTIEAADRVAAGETTTVLVSLTVDKVTPDVAVLSTGGGTSKTPEGALSLPMPADAARMDVKVVLRAAGFDLDPTTPEEATIEIDRTGEFDHGAFSHHRTAGRGRSARVARDAVARQRISRQHFPQDRDRAGTAGRIRPGNARGARRRDRATRAVAPSAARALPGRTLRLNPLRLRCPTA